MAAQHTDDGGPANHAVHTDDVLDDLRGQLRSAEDAIAQLEVRPQP